VTAKDSKLAGKVSPFVLLCVLGGLAIFSTTMSKSPALPLFIHSLGVPENTAGFVAAASTIVGIVVSLPAGMLSDLYGRRRVMIVSAFVFASAPFLYLLVRGPWQLVIVRIYHGLATAILGPVALALVADTGEARRGERMAWYSSATMVGRLLAPSIGGLLIVGQDFRWVYLGCGLAGLLALLVAVYLPLTGQSIQGGGTPGLSSAWQQLREEARYVIRHRGILTTSFAQAAQYFAFGFLEVYLPLRLTAVGWKVWQIGPLFTLQVLVTTVGKPVMGRLADRLGRVTLIVGGLVAGAAGLRLASVATSYALLIVSASLFGLGAATVTTSTAALVSDLAHQDAQGAALGILSSIMDIGHSTGPMVGGLLVGAFGYATAFGSVAAILTVTAVAFLLVIRRHRRRPAQKTRGKEDRDQ
jgi:DHA1 family multidrug resistance protein-like MFS transporter